MFDSASIGAKKSMGKVFDLTDPTLQTCMQEYKSYRSRPDEHMPDHADYIDPSGLNDVRPGQVSISRLLFFCSCAYAILV